jgi:long-chain acyl-CoA synthetase
VTATECEIVDPETFEPVPDGTPGEIAIRGPQVVPGYWKRPDADADAFREGWLRTGDLGVRDAAGWYYLVDRIKDLINSSGFKIAPREVEDVLHAHKAVRTAAVVGGPDSYRGERVHAFVVLREGMSADAEALISHCRDRLAAYKCPRTIEFVDDLPRTASGKVMRRALRDALKS